MSLNVFEDPEHIQTPYYMMTGNINFFRTSTMINMTYSQIDQHFTPSTIHPIGPGHPKSRG